MSPPSNEVCILLSTYNGGLFLREQIHSLKNQTFTNFDIIARDDGSLDNSVEILIQEGIKVLPDNNNLGPQSSFIKLIQAALEVDHYKYFLFCDQDDIWYNTKIETLLNAVKSSCNDKTKPILAFSDLVVVNEHNEEIAPSFFALQQLNPYRIKLNQLLTQNVVTGCSTLFNKELATLVSKLNKDVLMHDWACAILASIFGELIFVDQGLVRYRQHKNNTIGVKKITTTEYSALFKKMLSGKLQPLNSNIKQANSIYNVHQSRLTSADLKIFQSFISLKNQSAFKKIYWVFKFDFLKHGFIRNAAMILGILFEKPNS